MVAAFLPGCLMTLGVTSRQADLFRSTAAVCEGRAAADPIYGISHPGVLFAQLFPDGVQMTAELLADLEQWARLTGRLASRSGAVS